MITQTPQPSEPILIAFAKSIKRGLVIILVPFFAFFTLASFWLLEEVRYQDLEMLIEPARQLRQVSIRYNSLRLHASEKYLIFAFMEQSDEAFTLYKRLLISDLILDGTKAKHNETKSLKFHVGVNENRTNITAGTSGQPAGSTTVLSSIISQSNARLQQLRAALSSRLNLESPPDQNYLRIILRTSDPKQDALNLRRLHEENSRVVKLFWLSKIETTIHRLTEKRGNIQNLFFRQRLDHALSILRTQQRLLQSVAPFPAYIVHGPAFVGNSSLSKRLAWLVAAAAGGLFVGLVIWFSLISSGLSYYRSTKYSTGGESS